MDLRERLEKVTAHRKSRYDNALFVVNNPELFEQLVPLCFTDDETIAVRASWVFEFVYAERPDWLLPHFNYWVHQLPKAAYDSNKRPLCRILLQFIQASTKKEEYSKLLTPPVKEYIIEICFDWLINDEKVALKCYSMRILNILGKETDWVYPELEIILQQNIPTQSAAYKAAAKDVLNNIKKYEIPNLKRRPGF